MASIGLYNYGARFYSNSLARFLSADTIVPSPGNPQSLNRYAYVSNNPLKYTDPTGHFKQCDGYGNCYDDGYSVSNPGFTSYDADERRMKLVAYNNNLWWWVKAGWITDLEAFAELTGYAASMIPKDISGDRAGIFVQDVGSVLTEQLGDYYYNQTRKLGQSGFDPNFQDPGAGGNQPHHFWFYVMAGYQSRSVAWLGNFSHETWLTQDTLRSIASAFSGPRINLVGRSYQDYALGEEGIMLGAALKRREIEIGQVSSYIQTNLKPGGAAGPRWNGTILAQYNKQIYSFCLDVAKIFLP